MSGLLRLMVLFVARVGLGIFFMLSLNHVTDPAVSATLFSLFLFALVMSLEDK